MSCLDGLLMGWALVATGFTVVTLGRLMLPGAAFSRGTPRCWPPVVLLRPVDEPTAHERSLWTHPIDYPGDLEQVVVSPLRYSSPEGARWLRSTPAGPNRKVGHLAFAVENLLVHGRVVVSADADVRVDGSLVKALVAEVLGGAALASAPPEPTGGSGLASIAWRGLLVSSHHSFVSLGVMTAGAPALCGKALALGPTALAELNALTELAGEDLELAERLHRRGERVVTVAVSAECPLAPDLRTRAVTQRATRWMRVLLAHRPGLAVSVPLLLAPAPLLWLGAIAHPSPGTWGAVLALSLARSVLAMLLGGRSRRGTRGWLAWVAGEVLVLAAFGRALWGGPLVWRGRAFRLEARGRLVPVDGVGR